MFNQNKNINDITKIKKRNIPIEGYFKKWDISKYPNLLIYNNDKNILNDNSYLIKIIEELDRLIQNDYENVLLPFLCPPCHKLLEYYINSSLDENKNIKSLKDFKYIHIFEKLKNNIFINKENISLIYSYFASLFYDAKEIEENDERLSKFLKLKELWKIFYTLPLDETETNKSNFSFIGGKLIFEIHEKYNILNHRINIKINFIKKNLDKMLNDNVNFLKLNDVIIDVKKDLREIRDLNNLWFIEFEISQQQTLFSYKIDGKELKEKKITHKQIEKINNITILENFYGQIQSIEIILKNCIIKEKSLYNLYYPIPANSTVELFNIKSIYYEENKNYLSKKKLCFTENNEIDLTIKQEQKDYSLRIDNNNFIKINFINYHEKNFNIIEYFGGVNQLLPFIGLIKNLHENEKIKIINNQNKTDILSSFVSYILGAFVDILSYYNDYKTEINKYFLIFIFIAELNSSLILKNYKINEKAFISLDNNLKTNSLFKDIFLLIINTLKTGENKELLIYLSNLDETFYKNAIDNYEYFFDQLYTKLMKELFIYNRNWSKKELFFNINKKDNKITLKYKQLNYFTKSFQQPFIYPILEIEKYYPDFTDFSKDKLYKNNNEKILNYDFSLSDNNIIKNSIKKIIKEKIHNKAIEFEKCCLVKKIYHVKGKLGIIKKEEGNKKSFNIIFISNDKDMNYTCNKDFKDMNYQYDSNKFFGEKNKDLCYGSICRCLKKEYNRKIIIKSEDIIFLLIREYFHRVSAIEIFTNNNKSYYFNFNKKFEPKIKKLKSNNNKNNNEINNNIKDDINSSDEYDDIEIENTSIKDIQNIIIFNINNNKGNFKAIIRNKILIGFYNKKYERYFYPLFKSKKSIYLSKFLSKYDILIFINLFSNRSFKDLYQYPIFPMFYDIIKHKRDMEKHIGFQECKSLPASTKRVEQINESYESSLEENDNQGKSQTVSLFNIYYSNAVFTSNFLIRVFPYSFSCIELQGNGFDNPNRLFYSIDSVMKNSLTQKCDLRELIPEFFYFHELFINKNNLEFNRTDDDRDIDDVKIIYNNQNEKNEDIYIFLTKMRNLLEKEENLNEWIDLIFGSKSEKDKNNRQYYPKESKANFENNEKIINDKIIMDCADFGLIPFKLFKKNFPSIKKDNIDKLKIYNNSTFNEDHFSNNLNPMKTCICLGRTIIEKKYLNIYKKKIEKLKDHLKLLNNQLDEFYFLFVGDIFGRITIYQINAKNCPKKLSMFKNKIKYYLKKGIKKGIKNTLNKLYTKCKRHSADSNQIKEKKEEMEDEENNEWLDIDDLEVENTIQENEDIKTFPAKLDGIYDDIRYEVTVFKKLYDHSEKVQYIDFNGRLNLFVTYGLDGFINLYLFPSCKLVNSIKVTNIVGCEIFERIFLISTPFPMIGCINKKLIYILDINGNFIHSEPVINYPDIKIYTDKNCGIVQDFITKDGKEYYFPFLEKLIGKT